MKPHIFSDWNGTLIDQKDDKPVLKQIGMDELKYCVKRPWKWGRAKKLVSLKKRLGGMVEEYRGDPETYTKLLKATYEIYGREVIPGISSIRILNSLEKYGLKAVKRLDGAFYEVCEIENNYPIFILTNALDDAVHEVKRRSGCKPFFIVDGSSIIYEDDIATEFQFKNYDDKYLALQGYMNNNPGERIVFMGNDFRDEPCAEIADIFVVAPLAKDEYRQRMVTKYGNKVRTPKSGEVYKALIFD